MAVTPRSPSTLWVATYVEAWLCHRVMIRSPLCKSEICRCVCVLVCGFGQIISLPLMVVGTVMSEMPWGSWPELPMQCWGQYSTAPRYLPTQKVAQLLLETPAILQGWLKNTSSSSARWPLVKWTATHGALKNSNGRFHVSVCMLIHSSRRWDGQILPPETCFGLNCRARSLRS